MPYTFRLRLLPAALGSVFVVFLLCAISADAQEAIQSDSSKVGSISINALSGLSRPRSIYWKTDFLKSSFTDLESQIPAVPEPAGVPIVLFSANFPAGSQSPAPILRGCGLVAINPGAGPVPASGENPIFSEGTRLLDDPRFGLLDEPQRQKYLGEWNGLHHWQENLLTQAKEIAADWKKVEIAVNDLDALGCRVKKEMDRIEPDLKTWAATCSGSLDQTTIDWCNNERERLLPLVKQRDDLIEEFKAAVGTYNDELYYPTFAKSGAWGEKVGLWEGKVQDFNERLTRALAMSAGKWSCSASCNVQQIDPEVKCPARTTGDASGPSEEVACRAAKRVATQATPEGCYPRHCQCACSKG